MKKLLLTLSAVLSLISATAQKHQTDTIEIASDRLAYPMKVCVTLPAQALQSDSKEKRFPVLYLLHGYSGDYSNWVKMGGNIDSLATVNEMIVVCPDGRDSWYWDSRYDDKMQMESFITKELIPEIDRRFPTRNCAGQRAVTGLSMGGQGAMFLAIRHPELFSAAGSMSGGLDIRPFPNNWKMKKALGPADKNKEVWEQTTIYNLVDSLKPGQLDIIFDCGADDFFHNVNLNLHNKLIEKKIAHDYISRPGKHNWKYWRNSLPYQMMFFRQKFSSRNNGQ